MAKDKVSVPSIQIGANKPGLAFGGVIYSADSQIGYNGESTKLNINVVQDTSITSSSTSKREFDIAKTDLNLANPVDIKLSNQLLFSNMFLTSYNQSTSVGNKMLNLTYSDGSVLLDRIFVGIIHQHFQIDRSKHTVPNLIEMTVQCPAPEVQIVDGVGHITCSATRVTKGLRKTFRDLATPTGVPQQPYKVIREDGANIWSGGWIVLGTEEYSELKCDLADVSYTFADLVASIKKFGIRFDSTKRGGESVNKFFARNYSGTLKDVLQNWGNDLGVSFYWDFSNQEPSLVMVDLTDRSIQSKFEAAVVSLDALDTGHGADLSGGSDLVINEKNHSNTLDGTFAQAFSSTFNRGPGAKQNNTKRTAEVHFGCQTLESISNNGYLMSRHINAFRHSMMLGKYSTDLRDIYNARIAIQTWDSNPFNTYTSRSMGYFNAIGFSDVIPLTFGYDFFSTDRAGRRIKAEILAHAGIENMMADFAGSWEQGDPPKSPDGHDYEIFFGVYDENLKEYVQSVESEIASSFYGKHYVLSAPQAEYFNCTPLYKILETLETKPSSQFYGGNQHYKTPMAKFAQRVDDLAVSSLVESGAMGKDHLSDENARLRVALADKCRDNIYLDRRKNGFFHFEREAPWSASKTDIDELLNPYTLQPVNKFHHRLAGTGVYGQFIPDTVQPRVKKNILKNFTPILVDMPALAQLAGTFSTAHPTLSRAYNMVAAAEAQGKRIAMCFVARDHNGLNPHRIGDITISGSPTKKSLHSNVIEEINALSSICERTTSATVKDTDDCTTLCEGDLMEELCSQSIFGQEDLSCGEAQAMKDSAFNMELASEKFGSKYVIRGAHLTLTRSRRKVHIGGGMAVPAKTELYADEMRGTGGHTFTQFATHITAPSENLHQGALVYTRDVTVTDFGIRKVFDDVQSKARPRISPQVSSIKYQTQDITQDVASVFSEESRAKLVEGEIPLDVVYDLSGSGGSIVKDDDLTQTEYVKLGFTTAQKYHEILRDNLSALEVDTVRESVNYKVYIDAGGGIGFSALIALLKQENGLDSVSITSDEGGYYLNITFSNRPPLVPELESIYRKVGPIAKSVGPKNTYIKNL